MDMNAIKRFVKLQFSGSNGDGLGIGRLSMRPSLDMRKTLREMSVESRLDKFFVILAAD